jgi:cytosine/adenosine deaminase-related metal-dependent hydrolase
MTEGLPIFRADVRVENGSIQDIGPALDAEGAETIGAEGCIVLPGFVQCHVHLTQSLFRGLANDVQLLDWLFQRVLPLEAAHDAESLYDSARLGLAELIRSGTTTVIDMGAARDVNSIFQAIEESGVRAQSGQLLMDSPETYAPLRQETSQALQAAQDAFVRWHLRDRGRIRCAFVPRGLLSVTSDLMIEVARLADQMDSPIHTHANENRDEIEQIVQRHGDRPVARMEAMGLASRRLQLAHCVWLEPREMDILSEREVKVVHCPSSNAKLSSGTAPVPEMLERGIDVSLGADGAPCNDNLDQFMEMRLAGLLQTLRLGPRALLAPQILSMATLGGARALGPEREVGTLEVGKKADLIILNGDGLHANPWEPASLLDLLVYGFRASDVATTIVDGRVLMRDRVLVSLPEREVLARARGSRERVIRRLGWDA